MENEHSRALVWYKRPVMRTRRDDAFSAELGNRLRQRLGERGWSQTDLAHTTGIDVSQINR